MTENASNMAYDYDDHTHAPIKVVRLAGDIDEDQHSPAHRHRCMELFLFETNGIKHIIDFDRHPVEAHSIHLVVPHTVHHLQRSVNTQGFVLLFDEQFCRQWQSTSRLWNALLIQGIIKSNIVNLDHSTYRWAHHMAELMAGIYESDSKKKESLLQNLLSNIMLIVTSSEANIDKNEPLAIALTHIENHINSNVQVREVALAAGVSQKKLNQAFSKVTGTNPSKYIIQRKILEAKRLLYHSEKTINEIAFALGYEDPSYFIRLFKKESNLTPGEFRTHMKKEYRFQ